MDRQLAVPQRGDVFGGAHGACLAVCACCAVGRVWSIPLDWHRHPGRILDHAALARRAATDADSGVYVLRSPRHHRHAVHQQFDRGRGSAQLALPVLQLVCPCIAPFVLDGPTLGGGEVRGRTQRCAYAVLWCLAQSSMRGTCFPRPPSHRWCCWARTPC